MLKILIKDWSEFGEHEKIVFERQVKNLFENWNCKWEMEMTK